MAEENRSRDLHRRSLLKALPWGGAVTGLSGLLSVVPHWAMASEKPMRGARVTFARASLANGILFHAGTTSMELYHDHPHNPDQEKVQPDDIRLQTRLVMRNHKEILDWHGFTWRNVIKVTRYQKRMSESPVIEEVMAEYFGDWWPATTAVEVTRLSSPQARVEVEIIAVPSNPVSG